MGRRDFSRDLRGLQGGLLPALSSHGLFSDACLSSFPSSFYKNTRPVGLGSYFMTSLNINDLLKGPISKCNNTARTSAYPWVREAIQKLTGPLILKGA